MKKAAYKSLVFAFLPFLFYSCLESGEGNNEDLFTGVAAARWDVGKSANLLLSADHFTAMKLELLYMEGYKPSQEMLDRMVSFLEQYTIKPEGIAVLLKEIPAMNKGGYSTEDIAKMENDYRTSYNEGNTISVFLLVVDGDYKQTDESSFTIGAAYRNTSLVLFGKQIEENSGGIRKPDKATLETTVALHEMGHLLGLVNSGSEMVNPHEDDENKNHCENEDCLMYWAIETNSIFGFMKQSIPTLDRNCKMDIRANGGR
jgi:predicted Zn-dependent protease